MKGGRERRGEEGGGLLKEIFSKLGFFIFPTEVFSSSSSERSLAPTGQRHQRSLSAFLFEQHWFISTRSVFFFLRHRKWGQRSNLSAHLYFLSIKSENRATDALWMFSFFQQDEWLVGRPAFIPLIQLIQRRERRDGSSAETFVPLHTWHVAAAAVWSDCNSHFHRTASLQYFY